MIDEDMFVTGSDNGNLCLWSALRKKPIFTIPLAHGTDQFLKSSTEDSDAKNDPQKPQARWITALATVPYSNLILSGSWDGVLRAWKVSEDKRTIESVGIVGNADYKDIHMNGLGNGDLRSQNGHEHSQENSDSQRLVRGLVNGMVVFEKGDRGNDGICIVAVVSKEHRIGKWKKVPKGRCEGIVYEVARI
jgi:ribosomal RNA-processing protein 9